MLGQTRLLSCSKQLVQKAYSVFKQRLPWVTNFSGATTFYFNLQWCQQASFVIAAQSRHFPLALMHSACDCLDCFSCTSQSAASLLVSPLVAIFYTSGQNGQLGQENLTSQAQLSTTSNNFLYTSNNNSLLTLHLVCSLKVLWQWASDNRVRQGMLLGVPSHKPACRWCKCDGCSLLTWSDIGVHILLTQQSSPL